MRRPHALPVLVVAALLAFSSCRGPSGRAPFEARVVGVSDGDTLTVLRGSEQVRIRLNGIDCPERGQPFGARAKQLASELAFGQTVKVIPGRKDRYGRVVADVVLPDGRVLNRELVAAGLAWHYTRYSKDKGLARLERQARAARVGVWSEGPAVAPWEFRAAQRGGGR